MNNSYVVIELQKNNGQIANIVTAYDELLDAQYKFHTVARAACLSNVDVHSVSILTDEGYSIQTATFKHKEDDSDFD